MGRRSEVASSRLSIRRRSAAQGGGAARNWHAIDAALGVPCVVGSDDDIAQRLALLAKQRSISGELFRNTDLEGKAEEQEPAKNHLGRQRQLLWAWLTPFAEIEPGPAESIDDKARDFLMRLPQEIVSRAEGSVGDDAEPALIQAANWCRAIPAPGRSGTQ